MKLIKTYIIPGEAFVFNPSEIGIYRQDKVVTVFIHDVDLMNPGAKDSNIKVF